MLSRTHLIVLAFFIHLIAAWFSVGHYHADEHSSILEFASYKLGVTSRQDLAWEYGAEVRSGFQPFIAWAFAKLLMMVDGYSPFLLTFILRLVSVALALFSVLFFFSAYRQTLAKKSQYYCLIALLFLWPLVFFHVRFSSEGWATSFLLIGIALWRYSLNSSSKRLCYLAGLAFGFAFLSRYQIGFMLLGFGLWLICFERQFILFIIFGGLSTLLLGGIFDYWLYGHPVVAWVNYFNFHITGEEFSRYAYPWWTYLTRSAAFVPPVSLFVCPIIIVFCWVFRRSEITWLLVPYIIFHMLTSNKQTRFLYPLLPFIPLMTAMLWDKFNFYIVRYRGWHVATLWLLKSSLVINMLMLSYPMFFPAASEIVLIRDCILPLARE